MKSFAHVACLTALLATAAFGQTDPDPATAAPENATEETGQSPGADAAAVPASDETEAGASEGTGPILNAAETTLEEWLWLKRPVVVFADSPADPRYVQQMQFITDRIEALVDRDVVVITDTDPAARSSVRTKLRARGFMLAILAKDGTIVARKPAPWSVREISRSIDKLPLRQQEVRDRRAATN
jgi:hypothetical protein